MGPDGSADVDIWVWSIARRTLSRLTFEPGPQQDPLWTPDGQRIVYTSFGSGATLFWRPADGTGTPEPLLDPRDEALRVQVIADGWSPDGRLLFEELRPAGEWDINTVATTANRTLAPLLAEPAYVEGAASVTREGRWVAYVSNESGRPQVYVRPFPDVNSGKWQVSTRGGTSPKWSADGRALYFLSDDGLMAAKVETGSTFSVSQPEPILKAPPRARLATRNLGGSFEVSPDGQRFLFLKGSDSVAPPNLNVVLNWATDLARLTKGR
jgi:serine/threonine-protein kinase